MQFTYAKGATPLEPDEIYNLIPQHLTHQSQLDEWEQFNINKAGRWMLTQKAKDILTIGFIKKLHFKMFCDTWKWAGDFRKMQTNIGIGSIYIPQELKVLIDDVIFWQNESVFSVREIAARLHHRLVFIHPFPNGNGRFSRLFADLFLIKANERRFSWGRENLVKSSEVRELYLRALKKADQGDYLDLIQFADC